jgi:Spy/CpxP family protein refolding chaperone
MTTSRSALAFGVALLAGTLATGSIATAEDTKPHDRQAWQQRMLTRLQERLGLSNEQVTAIRDVQDRNRDARVQVFRSLRQAQADLRALALNGTDDAALQQKAADIQTLVGQSVQLRVQTLREIAPLLTPEQRERFAQMKAWRRS